MKKLYLLILIGLVIALLISAAVTLEPGYVRVSFGNWLIESNLWIMLFLVTLFFSALFFGIAALRKIRKSPYMIGQLFSVRSEKKLSERTHQGLIAFLEGDWQEAKRQLGRSAEKSAIPVVNYLAAAHAASELGNHKDAEQFLKKAYEGNASELAVGIAQAQIQLQKGQLEPCLATLVRLRKSAPNNVLVLRLLKSTYQRLEDWQQLVQLMPALHHAGLNYEAESIEKSAWKNLFEQKAEELERLGQANNSPEELATLWRSSPESMRFEPSLIETYATQLIRLKHEDEAEILLRKALTKTWDKTLILLYGRVKGRSVAEQLIHAESWLKQRPNDAALLLSLGRLSLRNNLWGKAWEYFSASHRLQPSQTSIAELCRLSQEMNEDSASHAKLLSDLLATLKLPDLPMPGGKHKHGAEK